MSTFTTEEMLEYQWRIIDMNRHTLAMRYLKCSPDNIRFLRDFYDILKKECSTEAKLVRHLERFGYECVSARERKFVHIRRKDDPSLFFDIILNETMSVDALPHDLLADILIHHHYTKAQATAKRKETLEEKNMSEEDRAFMKKMDARVQESVRRRKMQEEEEVRTDSQEDAPCAKRPRMGEEAPWLPPQYRCIS